MSLPTIRGSLTFLGGILALIFWFVFGRDTQIDSQDYCSRTKKILDTTPLVDGHNDVPYLIRIEVQNQIYDANRFNFEHGLASHTDLERLRKGRVGGQFWSIFVECPNIESLDDPNHSVRDTLEQIDVAKRLFSNHPSHLTYCETSSCVKSAFKSGKIASMLGAEGLHQVGSAIGVIRQFFDLGVRYITLTHNCDNPFASAASTTTSTGDDEGLTSFGVAAVEEMNRLGMMVDLSHVSHNTMRQVLDITQSPVIFSHSSCYALAKNYRNVPDDVLYRLRENGGVIMIMFVKRFLNAENPDSANLETAVDHIFHAAEIAGWEHVGIGADFDGTVTLADGIEDVTAYPRLIEAVLRRGATDEQAKGLVGDNIMRAWKQNELNALKIQATGKLPIEDVWCGRGWSRWDNPLPLMIPGNPNRVKAANFE